VPELEAAPPPADIDRLFLLVPEGGFSYWMSTFATLEAAEAYVGSHFLQLPKTGIVAFWALDSELAVPDQVSTPDGPAEAVVMIRNPNVPSSVQLYTYMHMEAAYSSVRDSIAAGLDPGLVLLHWAQLVTLDVTPPARTDQAAAERTPSKPASARPQSALQSDRVYEAEEKADGDPATTEGEQGHLGSGTGTGSSLARTVARVYYWPGWDGLVASMVAASLLKQDVYDGIQRDPTAKGRAMLIVGLGAFAAGIGAAGSGLASALWHVLAGVAGWAAYAAIIYVVAIQVFGGRRTRPVEFFKAAGLGSSAAVLLTFGAVPVLGPLFVLAISVWVAVATATALAFVFELEKEPALLTAAVGWVAFFAISQVAPLLLLH
jgi:hypothetical protein